MDLLVVVGTPSVIRPTCPHDDTRRLQHVTTLHTALHYAAPATGDAIGTHCARHGDAGGDNGWHRRNARGTTPQLSSGKSFAWLRSIRDKRTVPRMCSGSSSSSSPCTTNARSITRYLRRGEAGNPNRVRQPLSHARTRPRQHVLRILLQHADENGCHAGAGNIDGAIQEPVRDDPVVRQLRAQQRRLRANGTLH